MNYPLPRNVCRVQLAQKTAPGNALPDPLGDQTKADKQFATKPDKSICCQHTIQSDASFSGDGL